MLEIVAVPAFSDNYLWLVHDAASGETAVVDPGDPAPVLAELDRRGWTLTQVWNTHWHPDHTGGNVAIKETTGATISGPAGEAIPGRDISLMEGDSVRLGHRGEARIAERIFMGAIELGVVRKLHQPAERRVHLLGRPLEQATAPHRE